jgi:hypothetical protein
MPRSWRNFSLKYVRNVAEKNLAKTMCNETFYEAEINGI